MSVDETEQREAQSTVIQEAVEPRSEDHGETVVPEPVFTPFSLTVGDGFKFGCGFTMALTIAVLIVLLAASIFWLTASLAGLAPAFGR